MLFCKDFEEAVLTAKYQALESIKLSPDQTFDDEWLIEIEPHEAICECGLVTKITTIFTSGSKLLYGSTAICETCNN